MKIAVFLFVAATVLAAHQAYAADGVSVVLARHVTNMASERVQAESNADIMKAKNDHPDLGGMVYLYLRNGTSAPVKVKNLSWNGADLKTHLDGPDYAAIWWRSTPEEIAPGEECEVTLCLRESLKKRTDFTIQFDSGSDLKCRVSPKADSPTLTTVRFDNGLASAYLYVEAVADEAPSGVYINGQPAGKSAKLVGGKLSNGLAIIKITPKEPFVAGKRYVFRVGEGKNGCATAIRAFDDLARFGTYGYQDSKTFSEAGLDAYNSFTALGKESLDAHQAVGMKVAMIIGGGKPDPSVIGHPAIYSYLAMDEPDCQDYSRDEKRPMHKRIGTVAQELIGWASECEKADPVTPTMTTVDLTFLPFNYFVYAKAADIANPDCYTLCISWPLTAVRDNMDIMKRASAPQPFTFTYQGYWEEWAEPVDGWRGPAAMAGGTEQFLSKTKIRGFGRAPAPEESRIPMLYAVGAGATGLFDYSAASEISGTFMFHSIRAIPESWDSVMKTSRQLRTVAPMIQIGHPTVWAKSSSKSLWVKTLAAGEKGALVVAVNEACKSETAGFVSAPVAKPEFSFRYTPWFKATYVYQVGDGKLEPVKTTRTKNTLTWTVDSIDAGEMFLVCENKSLADDLVRNYTTTTHTTTEGMKTPPEDYLKGRRKTPPLK